MRARTLAIIVLLVVPGATVAQDRLVYRCKDTGSGHLSFQSQPCRRDQVQEATYEATPDEVTARQGSAKRQTARPAPRVSGRSRGNNSRRGMRASMALIGASTECKRAREARDKAYRADHKMGYRARQKWGERVRKACG